MNISYRDIVHALVELRVPKTIRRAVVSAWVSLKRLIRALCDILLTKTILLSLMGAMLLLQIPVLGTILAYAVAAVGFVSALLDRIVSIFSRSNRD